MSERSQPMMPVAIIGMGCRFPGARDPDAFWRLLAGGVDAITEVPPDRWDIEAFYDPDLATPGTMSTRWGGFIADVDLFDARFFGVSPGEAKTMDPQQRLLLEVAWEAIEHAGIAPARLTGSRTGVFVGIGNNDYGMNCLDRPENINAYFASGNALCMSVNRLSHVFDLKGPSMAVDSGCSSSLAALHYACQSLRLDECTLALVGGVNLVLSPQGTVGLSQSWLTAADGRCKSFDTAADGYVRSDGCGMVILKLLSDALDDGDPILAVVRGSAVNQDGRSVTFTTPSAAAQVDVMRTALRHAGVDPREVSYVEAHGVGTAVMDAIEAQSIATLFGDGRSADDPCFVGSVKTNIGHVEWASGMASLIKVVLAMQHGAIPAHLHLESPIPPFRHGALRIPTELHAWPRRGAPRRAAVSAFGLGGTNVHAVIEEPPAPASTAEAERPAYLLVLSAQDPQALAELIERYAAVLDDDGRRYRAIELMDEAVDEPGSDSPGSLADICYTAGVGRAHFVHRVAMVVPSAAVLAEQVRRLATGQDAGGVRRGSVPEGARPCPIVRTTDCPDGPSSFATELAAIDPAFGHVLSRCAAILDPRLDLRAVLASVPIGDVVGVRLRTFVTQLGLAEMYRSFGVRLDAFVGTGMGELVAEVLLGARSLEDALEDVVDDRRSTYKDGYADAGRPANEPRESHGGNQTGQIVIAIGNGCIAYESGSAPPATPGAAAWEQVLHTLAVLYVNGVDIRWEAVDSRASRLRIPLPTYPFQRRPYWLDGRRRGGRRADAIPAPAADAPLRDELNRLPTGLRWDALLAGVRRDAAAVIGIETPDALDVSRGFFDVGMHSLAAMELRTLLQAAIGIAIPATVIFDRPTTWDLARWLGEQLDIRVPDGVPGAVPAAGRAPVARRKASRVPADSLAEREPIAITGIGLCFPGGLRSPGELWDLLRNGGDTIADVPASRWDRDAFYSDDPDAPGRMYTRHGSFVTDVDRFDAQFFGIAPREAESLDPQQRLLLEACWEALEHAGLSPVSLNGSRTGVFMALGSSGYAAIVSAAQGGATRVDAFAGTGNGSSFAAGRISYALGLHGPCLSVDTACSSSLVAVHLACQSLRSGESTLALAGGVNLILGPEGNVLLSRMRALSPDGRCKAFDASADGYGRGEGCGVVVLRRLSDAIAEGAPILAMIRGSAVNHDGRSGGLTVPNGAAQRSLLRDALADAGVDGRSIGYVEAHGTGTPLGDPIEVAAIAEVIGSGRPAEEPLRLGSIKANISHLESAAGVAGLIKVALAMHHEQIPPQIHFERWNPELPRAAAALEIPTTLLPWPRAARPRLAGISSFGMSGTNAHVIVEEAPAQPPRRPVIERPLDLLCLSAKSAPALRDAADRWATHLDTQASVPIGDVCYTSRAGRAHFTHRLAVVTGSVESARGALQAFAACARAPQVTQGVTSRTQLPRAAFLFSGQGSQYAGMGRGLFAVEPVFRAAIEDCDALLRPHLPRPLIAVMHEEAGERAPLDETLYTQPAVFALGYALARLWQSWGIVPAAVMGHSVGEYAAACIAGMLDLEDALRLVAARARLMDALPRTGEMVAVLGDPVTVAARLANAGPMVSLAAINGPANVVISGDRGAVHALVEALEADGIDTRPLRTSHAFHSPLMEPMLEELEQTARTVRLRDPTIPFVSNVTGQLLTSAPDAAYFRRHTREPVQFAAGIGALAAAGCDGFIEMGPHRTLLDMGARCLANTGAAWLPSLERGVPDTRAILGSVASLYTRGATIDWAAFDRGRDRRRVALPTYPFRRTRHWVGTSASGPAHPPAVDGPSTASPPRTQLLNLFVDVVE